MAFHDVRLPEDIERGVTGGPEFRTVIAQLAGGAEKRNQEWALPRRSWDAGYGMQTKEDFSRIQDFFILRRGRAHGFRFKDWSDFEAEASPFGVGDGAETVFQLSKRYTDGTNTLDQPIRKPVDGTVLIYVNDVLKTETTDYTIDYSTGVVTFVVAPTNTHVLEWSGEFDVPVRFDIDKLGVTLEHFDAGEVPSIPIIELRPGIGDA